MNRKGLTVGLAAERGADAGADGVVRSGDVQLLTELAEAFGDFGVGDVVGVIGAMVERGLEGRYDELCRLGARLVTSLDVLSVCGQRECFLALDLAGRVFRRVIEGDAACADGYRLLALVHMTLGRWREAVDVTREWEMAFGDEGQSGFRDVLYVRSVAQISGGCVAEAVFNLSRLRELTGGDDESSFGLGVAFLVAGEREKFEGELGRLETSGSPLAVALKELAGLPAVTYGDFIRLLRGGAGATRLARLLKFEMLGDAERRVLVVEDNRIVLDGVRTVLESEGWVVEYETHGERALKVLRSEREFAAAIFDNEVPGIEGLELIWYARRLPHREGLPIAMLSGSDCRERAIEAGAGEFLRKPQDVGRLAVTVRDLVGAGRPRAVA